MGRQYINNLLSIKQFKSGRQRLEPRILLVQGLDSYFIVVSCLAPSLAQELPHIDCILYSQSFSYIFPQLPCKVVIITPICMRKSRLRGIKQFT